MIEGTFETHVTVLAHQRAALAEFAGAHGLKYVCIELDRGLTRHQPMLTLHGSGTLEDQQAAARDWCARLGDAGMRPTRTKIEATPWCTGVPETDRAARAEPDDRYFEHHVKLRLPSAAVAGLLAVTALAEAHGARLSRNARRRGTDGGEERFVNQRCHRVGRVTASERLDRLVADLRAAGHEVVTVEQEYVVYDSDIGVDVGWLSVPRVTQREEDRWGQRLMKRVAERHYPVTFQPLARGRGVAQRAAFDPALQQHPNAYTAGEPVFADPAVGHRWTGARRAAMRHLLAVIAGTRWADQLVLRGSSTLAAWVGAAAREPGDLDFVVVPPTVTSDSAEARALLAGITAAVAGTPGAGLRPERTTHSEIWTYERADGRRLVIPFAGVGIPDGTVQVDVVFGEHLPIPPEPITVPGVPRPMPAATAELSLAWKLQWLATDKYPQGKDLYDAVVLAEYTTVDLGLVRDLMRPELGRLADEFTAETVLGWRDVDWGNFADEYPGVRGTAEEWQRRLALALDRSSS